MASSITDLAMKIRHRGPTLGTVLGFQMKVQKYHRQEEVRKMRNLCMAVRLAYPNVRLSANPLLDEETLGLIKETLRPYYCPNPKWDVSQDMWEIFHKIKEPPR